MKGNLEIVKLLTESGALLDRKTKDGRTALYLAAQEGHVELSKYLADQYPAAITQATNSGRYPTQAAAISGTQAAFETTRYLLSHATIALPAILAHRDNSGRNILLDSAVSQNLQLLKFLLDQGAEANDADSLGRNMIHHAAMMGHLNVLRMLNTLDGLDWNVQDTWDLWSPLMHAARQGHLDIVKYLIETVKVDANAQDTQGRTAYDIGEFFSFSFFLIVHWFM
ncbi:ankyrin repeat-containing domain protein [Parasitella parasitica]|nr:ankyrin repeat-containing domain protein [Parasitella parasitica]